MSPDNQLSPQAGPNKSLINPSTGCLKESEPQNQQTTCQPPPTTGDDQGKVECPLCVLLVDDTSTPNLVTCKHRVCLECMQRYITTEINHSRLNITCPICSEALHPSCIKRILSDEKLYIKYESFMLRRVLAADPDTRWCPAPDCGYAVLASGFAGCPRLVCGRPGCNTAFCYNCKQDWHPNLTCTAASIEKNRQLHHLYNMSESLGASESTSNSSTTTSSSSSLSGTPSSSRTTESNASGSTSTSTSSSIASDNHGRSSKSKSKHSPSQKHHNKQQQKQPQNGVNASTSYRTEDIKECPICASRIIKMNDGSCNHMTCSICGTQFCWLCMKEITDLHYISPSGCTFWGKKPWSKKKKLLWQLGILVGAPVCIILLAGVAVPAIVIGIPVWAARKLHNRLEGKKFSKYRKNAIITSGVLLSFVVSPIISAITLAIGIPILLGYVYGVVPLSLCRSSGCCLSTAPSLENLQYDFRAARAANIQGTEITSIDAGLNRGLGESNIGETSLQMSQISLDTHK